MTATEWPALAVRAASLYLPITVAAALALHGRPDRRRVAGAVLATAWNLAAVLAVNLVGMAAGWWSFRAATATVAGVPADLWLGWALWWGAVPLLASPDRSLLVGAGLVAADLVAMPMASAVVVLEGTWLVGEAVAVLVCLVPGLLLGRWTARDECLAGRATLQLIAFTGLLFFVVPVLGFTVAGGGWATLLARPRWQFVLAGVLLGPVAAMGVQAVREFAGHGGTPLPIDPPARLVTTGPYAYVANPMQLAGTVLLAGWGVLLASPAVVAAALAAAAFSAGLAAWSEDNQLGERFGGEWHRYRGAVATWLPRWRPVGMEQAVVYVDGSCEPCSQVGAFLSRRDLIGLEVRPAHECPSEIRRITYQQAGASFAGIAAVGRSLEHANLGWAAISWMVRCPGIQQLLQLVTDAVGGGPRPAGRPAVPAEGADLP